MKRTIYQCDNCGDISDVKRGIENVFGIHLQTDLFDNTKSFPIEAKDLDKCSVHVCLECVRQNVEIPAGNQVNKGKDREKWELKRAELSYLLRSRLVYSFLEKKKK